MVVLCCYILLRPPPSLLGLCSVSQQAALFKETLVPAAVLTGARWASEWRQTTVMEQGGGEKADVKEAEGRKGSSLHRPTHHFSHQPHLLPFPGPLFTCNLPHSIYCIRLLSALHCCQSQTKVGEGTGVLHKWICEVPFCWHCLSSG